MTTSSRFMRLKPGHPCPICGRCKHCVVSADGAVCICMWIEAGSVKIIYCLEVGDGYLHRLIDRQTSRRFRGRRTRTIPFLQMTRPDLTQRNADAQAMVSQDRLADLAYELGLSADTLSRLGIGYTFDTGRLNQIFDAGDILRRPGFWTFPMFDARGAIVGMMQRMPDGKKKIIAGGHPGLFIPSDLPKGGQLLICEGATDTAAMLDIGFDAIGRPSAKGGERLAVDFVRASGFDDVVIVSDNDAAGTGQRGAENLAGVLVLYVHRVRIVTPPVKDARAWKIAGATAADVQAAIDAAPACKMSIASRRAA